MRMLCRGVQAPILELCEQLNEETDEYHQMDEYSKLLQMSIRTIIQTEEEKEVLSLFRAGGTTALIDKLRGIEDFKLVSFLIVK